MFGMAAFMRHLHLCRVFVTPGARAWDDGLSTCGGGNEVWCRDKEWEKEFVVVGIMMTGDIHPRSFSAMHHVSRVTCHVARHRDDELQSVHHSHVTAPCHAAMHDSHESRHGWKWQCSDQSKTLHFCLLWFRTRASWGWQRTTVRRRGKWKLPWVPRAACVGSDGSRECDRARDHVTSVTSVTCDYLATTGN